MSAMTADSVLDRLEEATRAAIALARELAAARRDGDEWTRLPAADGRCPVSAFSRSKINRLIAAGSVRAKSVGGARFYAAADVRRLLAG
jgi:hypothetical protein